MRNGSQENVAETIFDYKQMNLKLTSDGPS